MRAKNPVSAIAICLAAIAAPAGGALAAEGEHKPHVHGESKMNLALEGERSGDRARIAGARHRGLRAHAEDEGAARCGQARRRRAPERRSAVPPVAGAGCKLQEAEVETPLAEADDHAHKEDDHAHKEGEHADEEEVHSEFHAHYRFRCADPARLKAVEVKLFESFGKMEEIELGAVLPGGQRAKTLKPGSNRFDF